MTGTLCEERRSHLRFVARATWAINDKTCRAAGAHELSHVQHCANRATTAGTADGAVSESLNETRDVLPIAALRSEHNDLPIPPPVRRHHDSFMPENINRKPATLSHCVMIFPSFDFDFCSGAENADK